MAAIELKRCVEELNFCGVLVNDFSQIEKLDSAIYLDLKKYWPFWGVVEELDVPFFKIASGEIANIPMINFIEKTNKPVVISTGLSSDDEIDRLLSIFGEARVTLLHCVSRYPTPAEKVNLNRLTSLKHKYPGCKIGLSDHSGTIFPSILALNFDIDLIELHIVFDRRAFGPDATSSLEPGEFLTVRNAIEFYSNMQDKLNSLKIDDDQAYRKTMLRTFGRSAFAKLDIEKDSVITEDKIIMKKPGIGLSYDYVMGKTKSASRFLSIYLACALPAKRMPAVIMLPIMIFFIMSHLVFV